MSNKRILLKILRVLIPVFILGTVVAIAVWLVKTKPAPRKQKHQSMASLVETLTVKTGSHDITVKGMGTVLPVEEVVLQPELSGLVVWKHKNFVPGGIVHKGDVLLRIDARNYDVVLKQQEAVLEKASVDYQLELSRADVAVEEWNMMSQSGDVDDRSKSLALREPQLQAAKVAVQAASNLLSRAKLDLERTKIEVPFNAVVIDEFIDRGQLVSPPTHLANLAGTDAFRVEVSLPVRDLLRIKWPDINGDGGPSVVVLYDVGSEKPLVFKGKVTRILSSLDDNTRMARILVQVRDPLMLSEDHRDAGKQKLLLGAYVNVLIDGLPINNVVDLPDSVIHEGGQVWVMNSDDKLEVRDIEVVWRQNGRALVKGEIADREDVVSSHISTPVLGMKLRVKEKVTSSEGSSVKASGKKGKTGNEQ